MKLVTTSQPTATLRFSLRKLRRGATSFRNLAELY